MEEAELVVQIAQEYWWVGPAVTVVAAAMAWIQAARAYRIAGRYIPGWRYERYGPWYVFRNESPETAYDVVVSAPPMWDASGHSTQAEVTPWSSFMIEFETDNSPLPHEMVTIEWSRKPGGRKRLQWRAPLLITWQEQPDKQG